MKKVLFLLVVLPMLFAACSSDEDNETWNISESNIELNVNEEINVSSNQKVSWKSENPLIATVNEKGRILALLVGKTKIVVSNSNEIKEINVTVKGNCNYIVEPFLKFSDSYSKIQSYENREKYMYSTDEELIYWGEDNGIIDNVRYKFDNGKMTSCMLVTHYANYESVLDYLSERYVPLKEEGNFIYLASPDGKTLVGLTISISPKIAIHTYKTNKFLCVMYSGEK